MRLRNRIIIVNLSIAVGLGIEALWGAPPAILFVAGLALYLFVNVIFWRRVNKSR